MKIITPALWFTSAAVIFGVAAAQNMIELVPISLFAGGIGFGTLFPALKERWSSQHPAANTPSRLSELEERLRITEEELTSATRELAALKEQQTFDLELQLRKPQLDNARLGSAPERPSVVAPDPEGHQPQSAPVP